MYKKGGSTEDKNDDNDKGDSISAQLLLLKEYFLQCVEDFNIYIVVLIIPIEFINWYADRLTENPYTALHNQTVELPPYQNICDYCLRLNKSNLASPSCPLLNRSGVQFSFTYMYHGTDNDIVYIEMTIELIQEIRRYPEAHMEFCKSTTKIISSLKSFDQLIIILLVTNILILTHPIVTVDEIDKDQYFLKTDL